MAEELDKDKCADSSQQQLPLAAPQLGRGWKQNSLPSGISAASSSMPATPNALSPVTAAPATHTRSIAAIQRFAAALDAAGLGDPVVRALAGQLYGSNASDEPAAGCTTGSAKSSEGGAAPSSSRSNNSTTANSTSCSSIVNRQVQRFATDVSAAGLANITFMSIAASVPDGAPADAHGNSSSTSRYGSPTSSSNPALATGSSTATNQIRPVVPGHLTGYSAIGTLVPLRSSDYSTLPRTDGCHSNRFSEIGERDGPPYSWYGKWPGAAKPTAAGAATAACMQKGASEYAGQGAADRCALIKQSADSQEHDLQSYGSSDSCLSLVGTSEHMQPALLEQLSNRPTSLHRSDAPGSVPSSQESGLTGSAAELRQRLAAASKDPALGQHGSGLGSTRASLTAGAAMTAALGGLRKMFGLAGSRKAGSICTPQEPLEVENATGMDQMCSSTGSSALDRRLSIQSNSSSTGTPRDTTEDVSSSHGSSSSSQLQDGLSYPMQLDESLRCSTSTASGWTPPAAAAAATAGIGSAGGLAGHQLSNGSIGVSHRATPLISKEPLGSSNSSLRSAPDSRYSAADMPTSSSPLRLNPAQWCSTGLAAAAAAAAASVALSTRSRGSRKRSSSSSGSSDGGRHSASKRKCMTLLLLLSLVVLLTAAGLGVGVYFRLHRPTHKRHENDQAAAAAGARPVARFDDLGLTDAAALSGLVAPMSFQVVLAVPAVSAEQGCRTWFGSNERLQQFKSTFAASYSTALNQSVLQSSIVVITCGGTLVYNASSSNAVAAAATADDTSPKAPVIARTARTMLAYADIQPRTDAHPSATPQRSLLQQQPTQRPQQRKNVLTLVEVVTRFSMPAPPTLADRARIADIVVTGSSAILSDPMSRFFKVPSALTNFVPLSSDARSNGIALQPRTAVPGIMPSISYSRAPTCLFPLTRSNSMADDQGRFWSLMEGQECVFRPAAAAIPRSVARLVAWQDAAACIEQPNESNSVADNSGRLWGWQEGASCAFRNDSVAFNGARRGAAGVAAGIQGDASSTGLSVVWEAPPSCSFSPNRANAFPDTHGRLWSWEAGRSCVFRWQSLPRRL